MRVRILGPSFLHPGNTLRERSSNHPIKRRKNLASPMYEIEVTVTTYTPEELRLTADWPLIWLQALGSIEILRKLLPVEIVPSVTTI